MTNSNERINLPGGYYLKQNRDHEPYTIVVSDADVKDYAIGEISSINVKAFAAAMRPTAELELIRRLVNGITALLLEIRPFHDDRDCSIISNQRIKRIANAVKEATAHLNKAEGK